MLEACNCIHFMFLY